MKAKDSADIGRAIREARLSLGLSQLELSRKMRITQVAICHWETGQREPRLNDLLRLGTILGVDLLASLRSPVGQTLSDAALRGTEVGQSLTAAAERESRILPPGGRVSEPAVSYIYDTPRLDRVLPVYNMGHIAGTTDIEPFIDGEVGISAEMAKLADAVIRIHGTSMLPFFRDGDLVGIKKTPVAQPKQIVLAAVEGEMTFKRLAKITRGWVLLQPFNPEHELIQSRDIQILGVFRWLLRLRPDGKL